MQKSLSVFAVSACLVAFVPTCGAIQERASGASAAAASDGAEKDAGATALKTKHDTVKNIVGK